MTFVHDSPEFSDLLQIVAAERKLAPALVEKDYWVTHTLWALHAAGFEIWFKGGTSLSSDGPRWKAIRAAHDAIAPMFWGPRSSVDDACATIREWVKRALGSPFQGD